MEPVFYGFETLKFIDMDFDKLYDMFCEYYHDDGSNEEIMRGRIEKAFLKYAQVQVRLFAIIKSLPDSEEIRIKARELDEKDFDQWWWKTVYKGNVS